VAHNDIPYGSVRDGVGDLRVIYNAEWVKNKLNHQWPSFVFPPPVDSWYKCEDKGRNYITLINLNDNKGANYFYSLAKKLPQYQFLGVKGSYDGQIIQNLPNVTIWNNTPDIRKIYEVSKIMLMPSHYESWGKVASEAMLNGIPVIANPTPGLSENVGKGGLLINRKDTAKWKEEIAKLMEDDKYYQKWSKAALKRAKEQVPDLDGLEQFLTS
jgi:glycosyltransferase involved in cell wall biosynthesis